MSTRNSLSASLEDYLETIFLLVQEKRVARVKDIASRLGVQMPSVTGALRSLAAKNLVNHDPYSYITLTPEGEAIARDLVRRHGVLTDFLADFLGLDRKAADRNACEMEHAIEPVVLDRLVEFVEFAQTCPRADAQWLRGAAHACSRGERLRHCEECLERTLAEVRATRAAREEAGEPVPLTAVAAGARATVERIEANDEARARFEQSGLTAGALVEVESVEPNGPLNIKVRGYRLALSRAEGACVLVTAS